MKALWSKLDRDGDGQVTAAEGWGALRRELQKVTMDAPVVLSLCGACVAVHLVTVLIWPSLTQDYFQLWPWAYSSPGRVMFYVRMVTQVLGHASWEHLSGNLTLLILVGPASEVAYGPQVLMRVMLLTAVVTSLFHYLLAPRNAVQLGASGIAYMLIMLNSLRDHQAGQIRASFLALLVLWISKEGFSLLRSLMPGGASDGVSHHCHLLGAMVGAAAGLLLKEPAARVQAEQLCRRLLATLKTLPARLKLL
ncbi:unnamed protein product [Polarella glacialis]|uniref:EF-hand domain-containing protein n=1 Tax=Polarella glacialis TaxID=89957 RepID=A0A813LA59_POLGL|nr:unnamed protein product [Polarella glacialis]